MGRHQDGRPGRARRPDLAPVTQAWLATADDVDVTGRHFFHQRERAAPADARDPRRQDALLGYCAKLTGETLPDLR
ncbi:hypothetical protein [Amycolatopsis kentuckyensis]|uniref:hypothetical protein n=1 Tax=Amycolatopsis kentuckyensis TaxID=218823 RepID=UPI003561732E